MLVSKTEISNLTLGFCGVTQKIIDLDTETSAQAKVIRQHYEQCHRLFLQKHEWAFATRYVKLTQLSDDPNTGWGYSYRKPADALAVRQVAYQEQYLHRYQLDDEKIPFEEYLINGAEEIHTNLDTAYCEYTKNFSVDDLMPEYYGRGLAAFIAKECAPQLITGKYAQLEAMFNKRNDDRISEAIAIGITRAPRRKDAPSPFIRARR